MKILLANMPWLPADDSMAYGVRAGSRWPHLQRRAGDGELPRYIPFPFFMAYAEALLRASGFETLIVDAVASNMSEDEFRSKVLEFQPELFFAESSTPSLENDMRIAGELKQELASAFFVFSGTHAPAFVPPLFEEHKFLDYWIAGEYENSLCLLAQSLAAGAPPHPENIPGLIPRGGLWRNSFAACETLDSLPLPDFDALPVESYSDPVCGLPSPGAQSWLSRGCPFGCSFCVWPQIVYGSRKYRVRDIDKALDEVEMLIHEYSCESFYFDDDTCNIGEARMLELAEKIIKRGLDKYPWAMMARADCMTERMMEALSEAGLYAVKYGVESISPTLLDACSKGTNLEKFHEAIRFTAKAGVKMHLTFTFGLPGETEETINETMDFAIKTAPESAQFSLCTPFPGTVFYDECRSNKWLLTDDDWSRFLGSGGEAVVNTPWLSSFALRDGLAAALKRWHEFQEQRMNARKASLLADITDRVQAGQHWRLYGESDFASFIPRDGHNEIKADFAVIVSRHDEEKIYRRMLRDFGNRFDSENILRLYAQKYP